MLKGGRKLATIAYRQLVTFFFTNCLPSSSSGDECLIPGAVSVTVTLIQGSTVLHTLTDASFTEMLTSYFTFEFTFWWKKKGNSHQFLHLYSQVVTSKNMPMSFFIVCNDCIKVLQILCLFLTITDWSSSITGKPHVSWGRKRQLGNTLGKRVLGDRKMTKWKS